MKRADANMAMAEPHQHRRARRRRLIPAHQVFARFDDRECLGGFNAKRLQHLGRQYLADGPLQCQSPVAVAAVWCSPRTFGAKVQQAPQMITHLRKQETATIADIGIIVPELMPVITQRQWLWQIVG